ncbi:unnamed protein product [Agarophyton chilense]
MENLSYLSASLQCLLHVDTFVLGIESLESHKRQKHFCLLHKLNDIVSLYKEDKYNCSPPEKLQEALLQKASKLCGKNLHTNSEEDPAAFIKWLVEEMELVEWKGCHTHGKPDKEFLGVLQHTASGILSIAATCSSCEFEYKQYSTFVLLNRDDSNVVEYNENFLERMIANTGTVPSFCSYCRVGISGDIKVRLEKSPNLLMLRVNRETQEGENRLVKYSDTLDISTYVKGEETDSIYDLKAVVYKDESSTQNHYVADVRIGHDDWSRVDGFIRERIRSEEALKRQALILFYEKRYVKIAQMEDISSSSSYMSEIDLTVDIPRPEGGRNICCLC